MPSIKQETLHGVKWNAISSIFTKITTFLLGIVLARLLSPEDYGIVGMATIFFSLSNILIDGGFTLSLIRKKDVTIEDTSTVFFFNVVASALCCVLIIIYSKDIALFLNAPILEEIVKIPAIGLFIGSLGGVHWTLITKNVDFKTPALINMPLSVITGVIGIFLAYLGYGPWALVWSSFAGICIKTIYIWFKSPWRPRLIFSISSFKNFFSFSGNLVLNSFLDVFFNQGIGMIIGKFYTPAKLGYYSKAQNTASLPSTFLYSMVENVVFPVLSKIKDNETQLLNVYSRFMRVMSLVMFFAMMLCTSISKPLIIFLYSDKWLPAVVYMQLFCLNFMFYHIHGINWNLLIVKGRSDWAFKKELINKGLRIVLIICSVPFGPIYICLSLLISSLLELCINTYITGRLFKYGLRKQMADFGPYLILSALCCTPSFFISAFNLHPFLSLCIQVPLSCVLYLGCLIGRKNSDFMFLVNLTPLSKYINKYETQGK